MEEDDKNRCEGNKQEKDVENITLTPHNSSHTLEDNAENPVREITQTDHLNKRLLSAFLAKINHKGDNLVETNNFSNSDDWETDTLSK